MRFGLLFPIALFIFNPCFSQHAPIQDYLTIPGPLKFDTAKYLLSWSFSNHSNYFKQEYLPENSDIDHYDKMILIEILTGNINLENAVALKIAELQQRKKTDPILNFKLHNTADNSEYLLDFVVSEGKPKLTMVEWNAYRYRLFRDKAGHHGVMLLGISFRDYNNIDRFLGSLTNIRRREINAMEDFQIPSIELK